MYDLRLQFAKITGRFVGNFSRWLKLGSGSVIGGRAALLVDDELPRKSKRYFQKGIIFITGTNGKSTTTYYIATILRNLGYTVATNYSGANMRAGVTTACLGLKAPVDFGVFEVDEASVARLTNELQPSHIICLNFSRDQLDRYAEIEMVTDKIISAANANKAEVIYNYGNPHSASLGHRVHHSSGYIVEINDPNPTLDIPACPGCSIGLLTYTEAMLGCTHCDFTSEAPVLTSSYNEGILKVLGKVVGASSPELADTLTACALLLQQLGLSDDKIIPAIERTPPLPVHHVSFSGGELLLGKNPESFNRLIKQVLVKKPVQVVFAINDNYADGLDTSWLWDVDVQLLRRTQLPVYITGQAAADIALRLQVAGIDSISLDDKQLLELCATKEKTMILANYTAYTAIESALRTHSTQVDQPLSATAAEYDYI